MALLALPCGSDGPGSIPAAAALPRGLQRWLQKAYSNDVATPAFSCEAGLPWVAAFLVPPWLAASSRQPGADHLPWGRDGAAYVPASLPHLPAPSIYDGGHAREAGFAPPSLRGSISV